MDWCPKDSDLLLSCGKDNRTIVWDTVQGIAIGDLSHSSNWNFDTHWYPRNPDLCVVSSFDGTVSVHSIQGNDQRAVEDIISPKSQVNLIEQVHDHNDPFSQVGVPEHSQDLQQPVFSLQKPPKWLRKPVGAMWGFGSSLVMFDAAHGPSITIKNIPIHEEIAFRADQLEFILNENNDETSGEYCEYMANSEFVTDQGDKEIWKFLKTLFSPNMKEELAEFLEVSLSFESEPRLAKLLKKMTHNVERSKEASTTSSPKSSQGVASPSGPNSFSLYSSKITEENDIDTLITKSVLMRDFETAVNVCISANRMADALAIAVSGGPDLLARTQNEYFKRNSTKSYSRILQGANSGNLEELIQSCRLDSNNVWKDLISLVCNYSNIEDLTYFLSIIGDKLLSSNDSLKHAASLCFMSAGNFYNVVSTWSEQLAISNSVEDIKILGMMEKLSLLRQAIRFEDSNLSLDQNEKAAQLNQLYEAYVEYAWIAANHGKLEVSWRFLEQVPVDFIPSHCSVDIIELRDRVYTNTGRVLGVTGGQPTFPFKLIDVFDMEAIRMAEELQRKQEEIRIQAEQKKRNMMLRNQGIANSAIHNNPPYGNPPGNAPYHQQGSYYPTSHWNQSYQPSHPDHYTQPEIHPINTANAQFQRKNSDVLLNQTAGVPQTPYIPSQGIL
jgi:protein transport protein SEC31